jgi:predicted component of type VI protein secretion system
VLGDFTGQPTEPLAQLKDRNRHNPDNDQVRRHELTWLFRREQVDEDAAGNIKVDLQVHG